MATSESTSEFVIALQMAFSITMAVSWNFRLDGFVSIWSISRIFHSLSCSGRHRRLVGANVCLFFFFFFKMDNETNEEQKKNNTNEIIKF